MKHTALWIALCIFIAIACLELGVILFLAQDDALKGQVIKVMERQTVLSGRVAALEGKQKKQKAGSTPEGVTSRREVSPSTGSGTRVPSRVEGKSEVGK